MADDRLQRKEFARSIEEATEAAMSLDLVLAANRSNVARMWNLPFITGKQDVPAVA
jgi:hypothetical protein